MSENESQPVNLDRTLARVRALIAKAEHEIAPGATETEREYALKEQQAAREMADALMFRYAIKQGMLDQSKPAEERTKPLKIEVQIGGWDSDILGYIGQLARDIAVHCRCMIREYGRYDYDAHAWMASVYGFESDVRYFEFLYTTLRLHMLGVLIPKFSPNLTMEENCYVLHNAGYNWLEMAAMQGWKKYPNQSGVAGHLLRYYNQATDQEMLSGKLGGLYKRPYERACATKGEPTVKLAAGTTANYRRDAAGGYTDQVRNRLRMIREQREGQGTGAEVILRSRFDDVEAMFREDNPELFPTETEKPEPGKQVKVRRTKIKYRTFSAAGYSSGVKHANTADLSPGMNTGQKREIS